MFTISRNALGQLPGDLLGNEGFSCPGLLYVCIATAWHKL